MRWAIDRENEKQLELIFLAEGSERKKKFPSTGKEKKIIEIICNLYGLKRLEIILESDVFPFSAYPLSLVFVFLVCKDLFLENNKYDLITIQIGSMEGK